MPKFVHTLPSGEVLTIHALPHFTERARAAFEEFISSDAVFGLDVETSAIEDGAPFDPDMKTRLIQFGDRSTAWVLDPHSAWRWIIEKFLRNKSKRFVSHNAAFDATRVQYEFGVKLGARSLDTLPMADLRFPGRTGPGGKGLKALTTHYIDPALSQAEDALYARMADMYRGQTAKLPKSFVPGVDLCRMPKRKGQEKCSNVSRADSLTGWCHEHYMERGAKLAKSKSKESEQKAWGWNNIPLDDPDYLLYGGLDAIMVRRVLDHLGDELKTFKMNALSKREQSVKRLMTAVSVKGHRVDPEWVAPLLGDIREKFDEAADVIELHTGVVARSPKLKPWLEKELGVKIPSLDKDHLPDLVRAYAHEGDDSRGAEVLRAKLAVSENSNILSNLTTIQNHAMRFGGFTHAQINTMQAHTGRMSVTSPAMQTFKKKDKRLRGCYIAREGHVLVGADYNSQEIRLGAALSRDPALLRIVREGLNQHVLTAMSIFENSAEAFAGCSIGGCGECEVCSAAKKAFPDEYAAAKVLDFAQQYGAGPKKIALQLGVSLQEAKDMWLGWRDTYAGLVAWSELVGSKARVRNPFGRSIPADPWRSYANGNYLIQSSGRDVLGEALIRLADAGWGRYFWLPIHDELVMEVPEDRADEACKALTEHMSTTVKGIDIPAEGEVIGHRWGGLAA